jgi:hypothetical protein
MLKIGPSSKPTRTFNHAQTDMRTLTAASLVMSISTACSSMPFFADWQLSLLANPRGSCDVRWVPTSRVAGACGG